MLENHFPPDVDILKVDIPANATPATPWVITRQSRHRYYVPIPPQRKTWEEPAVVGYEMAVDPHELPEDTDIYALLVKQVVSVTPLSIDLTSRVSLHELEALLRDGQGDASLRSA